METKLTKKELQKLENDRTFKRIFTAVRDEIDEEARTVPLAFSSEEPYQRWFGIEILGHEKDQVEMDFMAGGTAPLLVNHDPKEIVGVIEKAWIDPDRKGRAIVRFGRSARAEEVFQDVVDGIRRNVSVGYQINEMKLIESSEDEGKDVYMVTRWTPYEASLVSVPADTTVGVGRQQDDNGITASVKHQLESKKETIMSDVTKTTTTEPVVDVKQVENDVRTAELARIREIEALGKVHGFEEEATRAITDGKSIDQFRGYVLDELAKKGLTPVENPNPEIGLSEKETREFSFLRALNALANPTSRQFQEAASFEFECSRAVADKMKKQAKGIMVPLEVMKRDLVVGTDTAGGYTVATNLLAGSFIELLRNRMMVNQMGATTLSGLVGDLAIPKQSGGATAYWVAESGDPTESQQTLGQVALAPKTVGAFTDLSRKLLLQSSIDIENFVKGDLALVLALAIDLAAINGSGSSNQPLGILNTTGIGDVAGGTNGAAPTWDHIVDLWTAVAQDNAAFGSLGFLTNSKVIGKLMKTEKASNTAQFVCANFPDANGITGLAGARCGVSNQVPSNLTKGSSSGVCSAIIYGNWADLIIGMWGTLDLTVDPYTGSTSGTVRVVALQDVDVAVRHAESFAAMQDATTA